MANCDAAELMMQCFKAKKEIPASSNLIKKFPWSAKKQLRSLSRCTMMEQLAERENGGRAGGKTIVVSASEAQLITPDQVTKSNWERATEAWQRKRLEKEKKSSLKRLQGRRQGEAGSKCCTKGSAVQMAPQRPH